MRISVTLIQKNLIDKEEQIIADGPALLKDNRLSYVEKDTGLRHTVIFEKDRVILERAGEFPSRTELPLNGFGTSKVDSPYGAMEMETKLKRREKTAKCWMAEYQILSGGEVVLDQQLIWQLREFN